jgi:membrane protein
MIDTLKAKIQAFKARHPQLIAFIEKVSKDNIGLLSSVVAWNILTSLVPILVGLMAISGLILQHNPTLQQQVITHLSKAVRGVLTPTDLRDLVNVSVQHTGLLGIIGLLGILWGGSNVGGAIRAVFQSIFEVGSRSFIKGKLIDILMIFIFAILMIIIILATTAGAILDRFVASFPLPGAFQFLIGTLISFLAAFVLFALIYLIFPNTQPRLKFENVWSGAAVAAVLFQILSAIWPIYARFSHFGRYGAVLFPILVLTAWIYFFSMILMIGAEVVAFGVSHQARGGRQQIGPRPTDSVTHRIGVHGGSAS